MGPEIWLAVGIVSAVSLVGAGFWAGYRVGVAPAQRLRDRNSHLLAQLDEALAQGESGAQAARIVIQTERRLAAAHSAPAGERLRLLLSAGDSASDPSAGEADVDQGGDLEA